MDVVWGLPRCVWAKESMTLTFEALRGLAPSFLPQLPPLLALGSPVFLSIGEGKLGVAKAEMTLSCDCVW